MPRYAKKRAYDDESPDSGPEVTAKPAKKSKAAVTSSSSGSGKDADGNLYWELSPKRRVAINNFKGQTLIAIREYYEADGEMKPGKKGINITVEQYQEFLKAVPAINAALVEQGVAVEEADLQGEEKLSTVVKSEKKPPRSKSNIEATSDEDSD